MATGKYIKYLPRIMESVEKHFLQTRNNNRNEYEISYFVFTDGDFPAKERVYKIFQKRLGWPYDTMMRFQIYHKHRSYFEHLHYLFSFDADLIFVKDVAPEEVWA